MSALSMMNAVAVVLRLILGFLLVVTAVGNNTSGSNSRKQLSSRTVATKYGILKGLIVEPESDGGTRDLLPVEVFLGVPYASPPTGSMRFMPPGTPQHWKGIRMADRLASVCPQKPPDVRDEAAALKRMSQRRVEHLKHLTPFLTGSVEQQSEDCLYLNLYTPTIGDRKGAAATKSRLPVMVFIHGESFEWNSGNAYDGSVLASVGEVIVVTLNYRLGILGFLPPMESGGRGANNGLLDIVAALHWVQENVVEFGGDPGNVTVFGHGRGAALANLIMLTPMARGLIQRVILMSGSALSPWAMARDSVKYTKLIASELNCPLEDNRALIECLKSRSAEDIVAIGLSAGEFLTTFGPVVDGIAIPKEPALLMEEHGPNALFKTYELLVGMANNEGGLYLSHLEETYGMDGEQRRKHIRTLVRNLYSYHRQEIFVTVLNEYTDWTVSTAPKPSRIARETAEALGDALVAAPLVKTAQLHAKLGGKSTFMYVLDHQQEFNDPSDFVPHGCDLVYIFGAPLVDSQLGPFVGNFSVADQTLAQTVIEYWTKFVKFGTPMLVSSEPTEFPPSAQNAALDESQESLWPKYELAHQKHLVLGGKLEVDDHYHAHRLALWMNLIPQLHKPGGLEVDTPHHQLSEDEVHSVMHPHLQHQSEGVIRHHHDAVLDEKETTPSRSGFGFDSLLVRPGMPFASALGVTVAVGCSLLVLNALIFAAVYYQRDKTVKLLQKDPTMRSGRTMANDPSKQVSDAEEGVRGSFRSKCAVQDDKKSREIAQMESMCHSHSTTICGLHQTHEMHNCHEHKHLHQLAMPEVMTSPQVMSIEMEQTNMKENGPNELQMPPDLTRMTNFEHCAAQSMSINHCNPLLPSLGSGQTQLTIDGMLGNSVPLTVMGSSSMDDRHVLSMSNGQNLVFSLPSIGADRALDVGIILNHPQQQH